MMIISKINLYFIPVELGKQEKPCFEYVLDQTLFLISIKSILPIEKLRKFSENIFLLSHFFRL